MNLLLITDCPPYPPHSHAQMLVYYLSRELAARRYAIDLLGFYHQPEQIADIPRYESFFRDVQLFPLPPHPAQPHPLPQRAEDAASPALWNAIRTQLLDKQRYDLVQFVGGWRLGEYHALVKNMPNLFCLSAFEADRLREHVRQIPVGWRYNNQRRRAEQEYKQHHDYEAHAFDPFRTVVLPAAEQAQHLPNASTHVIPLGVDIDYFVPTGHEPHTPSLLFIADFSRAVFREAAQTLVETIFPAVQRVVPSLMLYIVGANPPQALRQRQSEQVIITGRVPDIRPYFELASVYVCPLPHSVGFRVETLQALAMMTPVITSTDGAEGLGLVQGQNVLLCRSTDDYIKGIITLLRDEQMRLRLQVTGREHVFKNFSWEQIANEYVAFHQQL